jgi:hypothetical protein
MLGPTIRTVISASLGIVSIEMASYLVRLQIGNLGLASPPTLRIPGSGDRR